MAPWKDESHHTLTTSVAHSSQNKGTIVGRNMLETSNVQNKLQNKVISSHKIILRIYALKRIYAQSHAPRHGDRNSSGKLPTDSRSFTILRASGEVLKMDPGHLSGICICHITFTQQGLYQEHSKGCLFSMLSH